MALETRRSRAMRPVAIGLGLLLLSSALALTPAGWPWGQSATERAALSFTGPFLRGINRIHNFSARLWIPLFETSRIREENRLLREELAGQQLATAELRGQLRSSNSRLALNEIPHGWGLRAISAPVHAVSPVPNARSLIIGRGTADGVLPGMAVLSPPGVAGVVRRATESQALVQLLVHRRSEWGAVAGERRCPGVLRGTGQWNQMTFLFEDASGDAVPGDRVLTSGISGSLFPSGLPVGTVEAVYFDKNGRRVADIRPLAVMDTPEEVFILLSRPSELAPELLKER